MPLQSACTGEFRFKYNFTQDLDITKINNNTLLANGMASSILKVEKSVSNECIYVKCSQFV